ncbi:MAG: pilus assembly protein N-terminal domain-containing protein [Planctomycetota bacterium]|nr:pilus assembly protein N-terminal domain-containing protein [Planctomycetota bacterium]
MQRKLHTNRPSQFADGVDAGLKSRVVAIVALAISVTASSAFGQQQQQQQFPPNYFPQLRVPNDQVQPAHAINATQMVQPRVMNPYFQMPQRTAAQTRSRSSNPLIRQIQAVDDANDETPTQTIMADRRIANLPKATYKMEVVHHHSQLIVTNGNKIKRTFISDPTVAELIQYTPTEFSIVGLERGKTDVIVWFDNDDQPIIYEVETVRDPTVDEQKRIDYGKLERKLAVLFPNSKVYLIPLSYKLVVKGQARDSEQAAQILNIVRGEVVNQDGSLGGAQPGAGGGGGGTGDPNSGGGGLNARNVASGYIVNMLTVPGERQLMLRVRIAQLSRSQARNMGVDFNVLFHNARHSITTSLGGVPGTLSGIFENGRIQSFINWLASNGTAKILAEPTLTVLSGHTASFISGGEFPVPTILGVSGGQTTSFRGFGTTLLVTPTITDKDMIRMRIVPEFSAINQGNSAGGIPGTDVRRVQTSVELREGQTIVLGGLISRQTNTEITRVPLLGEIPWIGSRLFNSKLSTEDETELLILVTPEIVRPMDPEEVPPMPGFNSVHPTDQELYQHALLEGAPRMEWYQVSPLGTPTQAQPVGYAFAAPQTPNFGPAAIPNGTFQHSNLTAPQTYGTYGRWAAPALPGQQSMMTPYAYGAPQTQAMPMMVPTQPGMGSYGNNGLEPAPLPNGGSMTPTNPQPGRLIPTPNTTPLPPLPIPNNGSTGNIGTGGIRQMGGLQPSYRSGASIQPIRYHPIPNGMNMGPTFPLQPTDPRSSYRSGRTAPDPRTVLQRRDDFVRYGTSQVPAADR